ncbi:MAG: hypothetical protein KIT84_31150 [Labilithrix sp.]|nr:hypothetical protein [Labilithrix sp.]MCW5815526.1 hypothetical protein [Labilithrix sp.]
MRDGLLRRGALLGGVGVVAVLVSLYDGSAADPKSLAALLAANAGGITVNADDLRWQPSEGALGDLFLGRWVLFLGSAERAGPRDVYRARVRVSPEGKVVGVGAIYNLTSTTIGDDHALVVSGSRAAYATWAYGKEQSVTMLDLAGEGVQSSATKLSDRAMGWVTNVQQTGSGAGIGRIDVTFEQPAERVGLAIDDRALAIELADDARSPAVSRRARLDLATGELVDVPGLRAEAGKHLPKALVHWAVDTVRAVPWIGPAPIAWLEEKTFALRDEAKQALFKMKSDGDALAMEPEVPQPAAILDTSEASLDLGHWPPPAIKSMWKTPEPGEGEWRPPKQPWVKRMPAHGAKEEPPSPFYETFVRPDEDRPYAKVVLVAMDMRQLDLGMEAGSEDPKPLTGPPGTGRVPRDPNLVPRIAACFNGGFKTEHGNYGMMLNKRVLLPPQPGAASVILTKDGRVGMGSWGSKPEVGHIHDVEKDEIVSFRQNLDPLVDNDKVNPQNRGQWGFVLPGTSMQTERTGLCVTNAGHMIYAWGDDTSATSLGKAMKAAGCVYGMHLDMNPHHTGFIYTNINAFKGRDYKSELLNSKMGIDTDRYLLYAPKDFFFMSLHDPRPPALEGVTWEADPGAQPAPAYMPGLWRGLAGSTQLLAIEPGRASFRVRAGTKEPLGSSDSDSPTATPASKKRRRDDDPAAPAAKASPPRGTQLSDDDAHRVLFALTLGISKTGGGLGADGQVLAKTKGEGTAMLSVSEDGALAIAPAKDFQLGVKGDAVELPLVLDDGKPTGREAAVALGVTAAGRVYVARNGDVAAALASAGCTRAVALDRGAGDRGSIFRAGTPTPPRSHYDDTTLYAMGKPLLPRGFRFEPTNPVEPPAPKKK